jgi:hypothetical protein
MSQGQVAGMVVGFLVVFAVCIGLFIAEFGVGLVFTIVVGLTLGLSVGLTRNTWAPLPKEACGTNSADFHLCDYNAACSGTKKKCVCNKGYVGDGTNCRSSSSSCSVYFCVALVTLL